MGVGGCVGVGGVGGVGVWVRGRVGVWVRQCVGVCGCGFFFELLILFFFKI